MLKQFDILIRPFKEKLENLLKIGSYKNINGSDGTLQEVQLKTLRNIEDAMKVGQFGFNSKAPLESRCVVAKIGNENIIIANEHIASIIDVASGDSIVYNENGDYVKIEKDLITLKAVNVLIEATDVEITSTTLTHNGTDIGDTHKHSQGADSAGNTQVNTNAPI